MRRSCTLSVDSCPPSCRETRSRDVCLRLTRIYSELVNVTTVFVKRYACRQDEGMVIMGHVGASDGLRGLSGWARGHAAKGRSGSCQKGA